MDITSAGNTLDLTLDDMNVDSLWQAGQYVYWQTGITMPAPPQEFEGYEKDTHCSAFAAAAALRLGVPLLHPNPPPQAGSRDSSRQPAGGLAPKPALRGGRASADG